MKMRRDNPLFLVAVGFAVAAAALTAVRAEARVVMDVIASEASDP